jgi:hypothetical protein
MLKYILHECLTVPGNRFSVPVSWSIRSYITTSLLYGASYSGHEMVQIIKNTKLL